MNVLYTISELDTIQEPIVYGMGTFDGLHLGHQSIIKEVVDSAKEHKGASVIVTFDAHPFTILQPKHIPPRLLQREERYAVLAELGVDYLLELPMSEALLAQSGTEFIHNLCANRNVPKIVVGTNFNFGYKGQGNSALIRELYPSIEVHDQELVRYDWIDAPISSTAIRSSVLRGDIELANQMLGRPYRFTGTVVKGDQRGRTLGFPTLNFHFPDEMATPADGVYVNEVQIDGKWYGAVGNMGDNPTFTNQYHRYETHLFNFSDDVYGKVATVEFLAFIRGEVKFDSLQALIDQMEDDKAFALEHLQHTEYKRG